MPNLKIYVDETLPTDRRAALIHALPALRAILCDALAVQDAACQFAVVSAVVLADLPRVNVEMQIMPHPDRSRDMLLALAARVQAHVGDASGTHTAVRIALLAPEGYVALK